MQVHSAPSGGEESRGTRKNHQANDNTFNASMCVDDGNFSFSQLAPL